MGKIIFWLVVVFVVLFVLRLVNVAKARAARATTRCAAAPTGAACRWCAACDCGVFLPQRRRARAGPTGSRCGDRACVQASADETVG